MEIEQQLLQLKRTERRRFRQICRANAYTTPARIATKLAQFVDYSDYTPNILTADLTWLFDKLAELHIDVEGTEWRTYWLAQRAAIKGIYWSYRDRPPRGGRDNKDYYNSSGGGGRHSIRYPRKVRSKGCWDRFYKLFPQAKSTVIVPEQIEATPRRFPTSGQPPKFNAKKK